MTLCRWDTHIPETHTHSHVHSTTFLTHVFLISMNIRYHIPPPPLQMSNLTVRSEYGGSPADSQAWCLCALCSFGAGTSGRLPGWTPWHWHLSRCIWWRRWWSQTGPHPGREKERKRERGLIAIRRDLIQRVPGLCRIQNSRIGKELQVESNSVSFYIF